MEYKYTQKFSFYSTNHTWTILLKHNHNGFGNYKGSMLAEDPIEWQQEGMENIDTSYMSASGHLNVIIREDDEENFFNIENIEEIKVLLYRDYAKKSDGSISGELYFQGYVLPEASSVDYSGYPHTMSVPIGDALRAAEYIRADNMLEFSEEKDYFLTILDIIQCWMNRLDLSIKRIFGLPPDLASYPLQEFVKVQYRKDYITPNGGKAGTYLQFDTYKEVFEKLLGNNAIKLCGTILYIDRPYRYTEETATSTNISKYYKGDRWDNTNTGFAYREFSAHKKDISDIASIYSENPTKTLIKRKYIGYEFENKYADINLRFEYEKFGDTTIINDNGVKILAQGNFSYLASKFMAVVLEENYVYEEGTGKISKRNQEGYFLIAKSGLTDDEFIQVANIQSYYPISSKNIKALLIEGKITQQNLTENDYDSHFLVEVCWGSVRQNVILQMKKNLFDNSDTNNFFSGYYDSLHSWNYPFDRENFKGAYFDIPPNNELNGYLTIRIYSSKGNNSQIVVKDFCVKAVPKFDNEDKTYIAPSPYLFNETEFIENPLKSYVGNKQDIFSPGTRNEGTHIITLDNTLATDKKSNFPLVIENYHSVKGQYYTFRGFGFNPATESVKLSLKHIIPSTVETNENNAW